ncbi:O-antigen ligase family protein [Demequina silvatica]|uniref:O-antigen ligase family protein n=1 Tax=Demequina silvatica TaxID=1638988 RepID=UPI0014703AE8|nr:O-antigen ligase family protein [Demequina silvatica]
MSIGWSRDPRGTVYALVALITTVVMGIAFSRYGLRAVTRGLLGGAIFVLVTSVVLAWVVPSVGRVSDAYGFGAIQGIYDHRNTFATVMVLGATMAIARLMAGEGRALVSLVMIAAFAAATISAQSSTALAITFAVLVVALGLAGASRIDVRILRAVLPITLIALLGFAVPWAVRSLDSIIVFLGRDETLTGRTEIWDLVLEASAESPAAGYGWGGVWTSQVGRSIQEAFGYEAANSAHNGYLEVLLEVGIVGLTLYVLTAAPALYRSVELAVSDRRFVSLALVLSVLLAYNVTEARAVRPVGTLILALVAASSLGLWRVPRHRARARPHDTSPRQRAAPSLQQETEPSSRRGHLNGRRSVRSSAMRSTSSSRRL